MDGLTIISLIINAALIVVAGALFMALMTSRRREMAATSETVDLRAKFDAANNLAARAETRLVDAERHQASLLADMERLRQDKDASEKARVDAERQAALEAQRVQETERRMADWEKVKAETMEAAKAAMLATTQQVSSKLLEDHKRENEESKKQSQETVQKTTAELLGHFKTISERVASLNDQVIRQGDTVDTVWNALSNPGGAGYYAEIGLENTLKSFGLEAGRDFKMQYSVFGEDGRLRPDAVVFLPGDALLVIDSKASKFLLDLADAADDDAVQESYANLAATMNTHLRNLAGKDYGTAVQQSFRESGHTGMPRRILNIMYLPNEAAVEKIAHADPEFSTKAVKQGIIVAGPTALTCLISFARVEIDLGRQIENQAEIVDKSQMLLDSMLVFLKHLDTVGSGLRTANKAFEKLASSGSSRLLPRMHKLRELGVRPSRNATIPHRIKGIDDRETIIDGEAEEAGDFDDEPKMLPGSDS